MGKITGFMELDRQDPRYPPAAARRRSYKGLVLPL